MSYRIFITGTPIAQVATQLLGDRGCILETGEPADTPDDLASKLARFDPDGLIVRQGRITGAVQDAARRLRVICKHGVGTDNIDLVEATRRGIVVLYTPGTNAEAVAEHALALMLSLVRRVPRQDQRIRRGVYDKRDYDGQELMGSTLGLVGFGRVARRLCDLVAPFEMKVLVYDPFCNLQVLPGHVSLVQTLDDLLPQVDVLSLHCPLSPSTRSLIDGRALATMKQGSYVVNTARGGIVDEDQLVEALKSGHLGGAALDVLESEPPATENPLLRLDNVILTPHVAGSSDRSLARMGLQAARNVLAVLDGDRVDPEFVVKGEVDAIRPLNGLAP